MTSSPNSTLGDAQVGAQGREDFCGEGESDGLRSEPPMSMISRSHTVFAQALAHANVSQAELARAIDKTEGYVARVMSGQHPVSAEMWRWAVERTSDPGLLAYLSPADRQVVSLPRDQVRDSLESVLAASGKTQHAMSLAHRMMHRPNPANAATDRMRLAAAIQEAMAALLEVERHALDISRKSEERHRANSNAAIKAGGYSLELPPGQMVEVRA